MFIVQLRLHNPHFGAPFYPFSFAGSSNSGEGGICQPGTFCTEGSVEEASCNVGHYNPNTNQSECQVSRYSLKKILVT